MLDSIQMTGLYWDVADTPNPKKLTASVLKSMGEIHALDRRQRPRKQVIVARLVEDWDNSFVIATIVQRKEHFSFHPNRFD